MFCVECGTETTIYKDGLCLPCYLKEHTFSKGPKVIDIVSCSHCEAYKYKNTWIREPFSRFIIRILTNHFTTSTELNKTKLTTDCEKKHKTSTCTATITGYINDHQITESHPITIRLKQTTCDICSKQHGGYYESILQIRGEEKQLPSTILTAIQDLIESYITEQQNQGNQGLFITEIAEEHGGLDFYLSDKTLGLTLAKKVYENYGGTIQQSSKNIGMKDGRQMYRMTYLIRLSKYHINDILKWNDHYYIIQKVKGNKITTRDLSTWKQTVIDTSKIKNPRLLNIKETLQKMIIVSESPEEVQLMHPATYKTVEIKKPTQNLKFSTDTILVINIDDEIFLKPD